MRPQSRNVLFLLTAGYLGLLVGLSLLLATVLKAQPRREISKTFAEESVSLTDFTKHRTTNSGPEPIVQREVGSTISVMVTVTASTTLLPDRFSLSQNYPNPSNSTTIIEYDLPIPTDVTVEIYNMLGQKVRTLVDDHRVAGSYRVEWDGNMSSGRAAASGVYLYRIQAGSFVETKKMLLLK